MAKTINTALREEIIAQMIFDETMEIENLEDAMNSFETAYTDIKNIFKEEITPWEAKIDGKIIFEDEMLLTIQMDSYIFTGGAHGHQAKRFLNFDKKRGTELENWQLFQNRSDFQEFAEQQFRKQEAIPAEASINDTGLMFERDHFYLPENIGFTNKGIKLLYNPYEVASYAEGPIELTLPYKEVKPFLAISL